MIRAFAAIALDDATRSGLAVRQVPPTAAQDVLRALPQARRPPAPHMITTPRDTPREGPVGLELRARLRRLAAR